MRGKVLAGFLFSSLVFAASDAAALYTTAEITVVPGGSPFPAVLEHRNLGWTDPTDFSWGLYPPSLVDRPVDQGFAYPTEWGPHYKLLELSCVGNPCLFCEEGPQPNQTIRITSIQRYPGGQGNPSDRLSYGHNHSGTSGPVGRFWKDGTSELSIGEGISTGSGYVYVLYETPEVSGVIQADFACDNGGSFPFVVGIGIRGLYPLDDVVDAPLELTGQTCEDLDGKRVNCDTCKYRWCDMLQFPELTGNCPAGPDGGPLPLVRHSLVDGHYGVPELRTALYELSRLFSDATMQNLKINDMSLPYGGTFDVNGDWVNPHKYHSLGIDVDLGIATWTTYTDKQGTVHDARPLALKLVDRAGLKHLFEHQKYCGYDFFENTGEDKTHLHVVLKEWH